LEKSTKEDREEVPSFVRKFPSPRGNRSKGTVIAEDGEKREGKRPPVNLDYAE